MKKLFVGLFSIITLILANTASVFAGANDFYFDSFEGDYYLSIGEQNQGNLKIEEKLTAVFPSTDQNHGIERCIPNKYKGAGYIDTSSITIYQDDLIADYTYRNTDDGFLCLRIGSGDLYVHGTVKYEIAYAYKNVIYRYADSNYQELYWDTNGTSWEQRFNSLTARLHMDDKIYSSLQKSEKTQTPISCYVGSYGISGTNRCTVTEKSDFEGKVITFSTTNLSAGENLTFNVMFKNGTFTATVQTKSYLLFFIAAGILAFFIVIIAVMISKRNKQSDKIKLAKDKVVAVQYTPMKGISVAEMAENYLKSTRGSANVATLMELATTHKIELEKGEKKTFGGYKWKIHVKNLDDVTREQEIVLEILNGGSEVKVGDIIDVKSRASTATLQLLARSFREKVVEGLKNKGLYEKDAKNNQKQGSSLVAILVVLFIFVPFMFMGIIFTIISEAFDTFSSTSGNTIYVGASYIIPTIVVLFVAFIITTIALAASTSKYKQRTLEGIKASKYLDGLKEYMELAEEERIKFLQSVEGADTSHNGIVKLYEKLLPYAIIFGLEESWMKELNKYYQMDDVSNPDWVTTGVLLSASDFHSFNTYTSSSISSSTMSESSGSSGGFSGGGGGGFSGGGGGGGGGGGW